MSDIEDHKLVEVSSKDLLPGRKTRNPIYDSEERLLIRSGMVITAELKNLLEKRGQCRLLMHREDALNSTNCTSSPDTNKDAFAIDQSIIAQLDEMLDDDSVFELDSGPLAKNDLVFHGCQAYDANVRQRLYEDHIATSRELNDFMKRAMRSEAVSGNAIASVAAVYLTELTADAENVLTVAAEAGQDKTIADHCLQLCRLSMALGIEMGLSAVDVRTLGLCGLIHDWGLARVPEHIRNADRQLSPVEYLAVMKHPGYTLELLRQIGGISRVIPLVCYQVHERVDGSGYPCGKAARRIHPFAKILNVADMYVSMTSRRPYRKPIAPYCVMECMLSLARENVVDRDVVRALLQVLTLFPIGSLAELDDGSLVRVLRRNPDNYTEPIVMRLRDRSWRRVDKEHALLDLKSSSRQVDRAVPDPRRNEAVVGPQEFARMIGLGDEST